MEKSSNPVLTPAEIEMINAGVLPKRFEGWYTIQELKALPPGKTF
jgi:hypothetical protein